MATVMSSATGHVITDSRVSRHMLGLLEQLTIEEKVALLSGHDFSTTVGIPRLNIPSLKLSDSTSSVKGASLQNPVTTACFPNTNALGATWDKDLIEEMGRSVAAQGKYKSAQVVLGPTINIHRDPRGGRNFEAFSEDPLLTGQLATALVKGIQSQGMGACAKHFVANDSETLRKKYDSIVDARTLREIYLAPFQWVLRDANPVLVMTSYNKLNGVYCSESPLINDVLRGEWGYQGSVMSDWYGTESRIPALKAGLDLEMPGPSKTRGKALVEDIRLGKISTEVIDQRVFGILKLVARTAEVHASKDELPGQDETTSSLVRRIASESMVLLKNDNNLLPLNLKSAPNMAIIGLPSTEFCIGGGSSSGIPQYFNSPYDSIKNRHPNQELVTLHSGVKMHRCIPIVPTARITAHNGKHGIDITYYNDGAEEVVYNEFQPHAMVFMLGHLKPGLKETGFTYHMTTSITPETDGLHTIAVLGTGAFDLFVDGVLILSKAEPDMIVTDFLFTPDVLEARTSVKMNANQSYSVKLVVQSRKAEEIGEPTLHSAKLCFMEEYSDDSAIKEAAALASKSEVSVVFAGRTDEWESEGSDLKDLQLPRSQSKLIKAVAAACPKTVVVLIGGNPFDVSEWISDVKAIIFAHFPGQEAGPAIADVLTGVVNPSGRLSATWPMDLESLPTYGNFPCIVTENGPTINYQEGLKFGYRHHWSRSGKSSARWDFGYGLSYTHFTYDSVNVTRSVAGQENMIDIEVLVKNDGPVAGAEVVQIYVEDVEASVWRPFKELKAFEKILLQPGEKKLVKIHMPEKYTFCFWDVKSDKWLAEPGEFRIHVADKVTSIVLKETITWTGL